MTLSLSVKGGRVVVCEGPTRHVVSVREAHAAVLALAGEAAANRLLGEVRGAAAVGEAEAETRGSRAAAEARASYRERVDAQALRLELQQIERRAR